MRDPLQALIEAGAVPATSFPANSRNRDVEVTELETGEGAPPIPHLRRRLVPPPERLGAVHNHAVVEGDRLDLLAGSYLGDPELYWRLCDANGALVPDELMKQVGRRLRIALAEGIPGVEND